MRRLAVAVVVLLLSLAGAERVAAVAATPGPDDVVGHFAAFTHSIGNPDFHGPATIEVRAQRGTRFTGDICLPPGPCTPVTGTVTPSGELTMHGRGVDVAMHPIRGRALGLDQDGVYSGRYECVGTDGGCDNGDLVAVHQAYDGGAFMGGGSWSGQARSLGIPDTQPVIALLTQDRTGAIRGSFSWGQGDPPEPIHDPPSERTFAIAGQTFGDPGTGGLLLVGATDDALLAVELAASPSTGGLEGDYRMVTFGGSGPSTQEGDVALLPAVQPGGGVAGA